MPAAGWDKQKKMIFEIQIISIARVIIIGLRGQALAIFAASLLIIQGFGLPSVLASGHPMKGFALR